LAHAYRCIVPDWPLGSHERGLHEGVDLSLPGIADLVGEFCAALELEDVTLVANDTGGAVAQWVAIRQSQRVGGLVLTPCDAFENFSPAVLRPCDPPAPSSRESPFATCVHEAGMREARVLLLAEPDRACLGSLACRALTPTGNMRADHPAPHPPRTAPFLQPGFHARTAYAARIFIRALPCAENARSCRAWGVLTSP